MPVSKIKSIKAREIRDSRRNPTIEVSLRTEKGVFRASVPSGASKGKYEAIELRDGGKRLKGKGVLKAVNNINKIIAPKLIGKNPEKQKEIDGILIKLDGTKDKSKLGANAILAVSLVCCRAGASSQNLPLYHYIANLGEVGPPLKLRKLARPCFNVINGGRHAANDLDFQEFMVVPRQTSFRKNLEIGIHIYRELKRIIRENYGAEALNLGDEGGFAPPINAPEQALDLIMEAAKNLGCHRKIDIILDVAATQFFKEGIYKTNIGSFNQEELSTYYLNLLKKYPIIGVEDPFSEDDWPGWKELKSKVKSQKSKALIIGDDLLVTNIERIKKARKENVCNAAIIKINQIGTVTQALGAAKLCQKYGWKMIVSHRSAETKDDFIADFAAGLGADFIKSGAPFPVERMAKYNRLLKIEQELNKH